jgi:hypothetical protein
VENIVLERTKEIAGLVRDLGLIVGVPTIIMVGMSLYDAQFKALEQQVKANEAQMKALEAQTYDRVAAQLKGQKEVYEADRDQILHRLDALTKQLNDSNSKIQTLTNSQRNVRDCLSRAAWLLENLPPPNTGSHTPPGLIEIPPTVEEKLSADYSSLRELGYLQSIMIKICDGEAAP